MGTYNLQPAAAWLRGHAQRTGQPPIPAQLLEKPLEALSATELETIVELGQQTGQKLYPFKAEKKDLPRVRRVLGFLKATGLTSLLDVGSGRGVFLLPFLETFPWVQVTAVELQEKWVTFLQELSRGGYENLTAVQEDFCGGAFPENCTDVVTMLEVLEHMPQPELAVQAAVKAARSYVVVSVPSKEDDNPEHIHLLTKEKLTKLFQTAGCTRLHFDGVNGHLILTVTVDK